MKRPSAENLAKLECLAKAVRYGGNPHHKNNPGDFGLTPPRAPRLGKTLCDTASIFQHRDALSLLKQGLRLGLVDARWSGEGWPSHVWAVSDQGAVLEAKLDAEGSYHGYPLAERDPLRESVTDAWTERYA